MFDLGSGTTHEGMKKQDINLKVEPGVELGFAQHVEFVHTVHKPGLIWIEK